MKKYLLTWYGITDLRASLKLEHGNGPVLGALLAGHYSNVIVLGYTHPNKVKDNELDIQQELRGMQNSDFLSQRKFIDRVANTPEAHTHFQDWLEKKLMEAGKKVQVQFEAETLNQLNDTEGIYEAAIRTLGTVAAIDGEKLVTLYLSPGTPVMAFIWAFAALRHPQLKKRLIASSQPEKPPEEIVLPNEWLEWHGKQVNHTPLDSSQYGVMFHLFGEQRMPSLLGMLQYSSKKHVFVNSPQYPAQVMKQFLGSADYGEISVDPFDPEDVRSKILDALSKMPSDTRVGFNLTGGTKLMYAGALAACRKVNATPFYFNSRNNQIIYLNDFISDDAKLIPSVEIFIKLNGKDLKISKSGRWEKLPGIGSSERKSLTYELWNARFKISRLYKDLLNYNNEFRPFELHNRDIYVRLSKEKNANISIGTKHYEFDNWSDFGKYLCGGWFEEYAYMELQPLLDAGMIKDMRIGLEVSFKDEPSNRKSQSFADQLRSQFGETYQELDVVFTDGRRLYIVECKSGLLKGVYLRKLESITRYFGGNEGQGILAYSKPTKSRVINQKAKEAHNISLVEGSDLLTAVKILLNKSRGQ
jgi:hypothetical protein